MPFFASDSVLIQRKITGAVTSLGSPRTTPETIVNNLSVDIQDYIKQKSQIFYDSAGDTALVDRIMYTDYMDVKVKDIVTDLGTGEVYIVNARPYRGTILKHLEVPLKAGTV